MRGIKNPTQYAVYLLSKREYSPNGLEQKLNKKFPEEKTENRTLIEKLTKEGYLSEERFSRAYGRYLQITTTKGPDAIKQSLIQKGVSPSMAQQTIETELQKEETIEALKKLIEKKSAELDRKYKRKQTENKELKTNDTNWHYEKKQKLVQFLVRKGYSLDMIYAQINE